MLGTGEAQFAPLAAGQELPLAAGAQGGFHVWLSFQVFGLAADEERVQLEVEAQRQAPGALELRLQSSLRLRSELGPNGDPLLDEAGRPGSGFVGYPLQIDDARCAHGDRLRIRVTLTDAIGVSASDEREVVLALAETFRSAACDE